MRTALNINAKSIHQELIDILGDNAYSYRTIADWSHRFKKGKISIEDEINVRTENKKDFCLMFQCKI